MTQEELDKIIELKVIDVDKMADVRSLSGRFYRKPEADKVIEYLQNQLSLARTSLLKSLATAQHEARTSKYKRCLAMAQVLEHVCPITNRKAKWRDKWHKRWLAIAEKFKESK